MATRYWVTGGDGNFNSTSNWASTSGATTGASAPISADDVFFDVNSGSGTVAINVSSSVNTINFTSFIGTVDFRDSLRVTRGLIFGTGMSFTNSTGTPNLIITGSNSGTMSSNGVAFPYRITFQPTRSVGGVMTLTDNWQASEIYLGTGSLSNLNLSGGRTFSITTSMANLTTNRLIQGTTNFVLTGTGTYSSSHTTGDFVPILTINTPGTISFATGNIGGRSNLSLTWTYVTGSIVGSTGTTLFAGQSDTFDLDGIVFGNLNLKPSTTENSVLTLLGDLDYTGNLYVDGTLTGQNRRTINGFKIKHLGNGTFTNSCTYLQGTTELSFQGSGTISADTTSRFFFKPVTINTTGTYSFGNNFRFTSSTFTYTSGNIVDNAISFIDNQSGTLTLNGVSGVTLGTVSIAPSAQGLAISVIANDTLRCNSLRLNRQYNAGINTVLNFTGSSGFDCNNFISDLVPGFNVRFRPSIDYKINSSIVFGSSYSIGTTVSGINLRSDISGQSARLVLAPNTRQEIAYTNFIDINATGQTIWVYGSTPTLTNCTNVIKFTQPRSAGG